MSAGREVLLPFCQVVRTPSRGTLTITLSGTFIEGGQNNPKPIFCNYVSVEPAKSGEASEAAPSKGFYHVVPTGQRWPAYGYINDAVNPSSISVSGALGSRFRYDQADQAANAGDASGGPAAGAAGVLGGPTTLTTLSLNNANMVSSVTLHSHLDTSCLMLVNYGVVQKSNHLKDAQTDVGR